MKQGICLLCSRQVFSSSRDAAVQSLANNLAASRHYPVLFRLIRDLNICTACLKEICVIGEARCSRCGKFLPNDPVETLCGDCTRQVHTNLTMNRSVMPYNDWAKKVMALYKYRGEERVADLLAVLLLGSYFRYYWQLDTGFITYVPLHVKRAEERGFNQVELLADRLGGYTGIPVIPILTRVKETAKQSKQASKRLRISSMRGAFAAEVNRDFQPSGIKPSQPILIIDDIYTTGSTLQACADQLRLIPELSGSPIYSLTVCR